MASAAQADPDTPITVKVSLDGQPRRFKLALRDVGINVLESKLRNALALPDDAEAIFERYSDSGSAYVLLDRANVAVYKQLYRAAKAKHKLKLRVTVKQNTPEEEEHGPKPASVADEPEEESRPSARPSAAECEPEQPTMLYSLYAAAGAQPDPEQLRQEQVDQELAELAETKPRVKEVYTDINSFTAEAAPAEVRSPVRPDTSSPPLPCNVECPAIHTNYAVCCNSCDITIPDAHYHCSTCDDGDFDLCERCVDQGVTCKGATHWLIKRFVKSGVIINSTTERLAPRNKPGEAQPKPAEDSPSTTERIIPVFNDNVYSTMRTCNCCVQELPEAEFAHCTSCEDFDLCRSCFAKDRHGHHPKHAFVPAVEGTRFDHEISRRLAAGRGQAHNAICDGCDKGVKGVRHKCLDCPDWDYCSDCVVNAGFIHPGHRFVPIYDPLEYDGNVRIRAMNRPVHVGICCDGPLCSDARINSSYIVGDRFKCAVCDDTDFCASCEASPGNSHNRTHPLIKFKSPVRHVSVTTTGENLNGRQMPVMGDRPKLRSSTWTPASPAGPTRIQTRSDLPSIVREEQRPSAGERIPRSPMPEPSSHKPATTDSPASVAVKEKTESPVSVKDLVATFVRDTVQDGTVFGLDHVFEQTWVLRNSGNVAWPAGCSVKFVGGDYMGHLDSNHPAATRDVEFSCESTICYASIQPGEEFPFTVLLRTPSRTGRFVSNWRLTTKEGERFGHRLWCDVVVQKPRVHLPPPKVETEPEAKLEPEVKPEPEVRSESEAKPEPDAELEHSHMIFPKLEKESPVASVHEESKAESVSAQEDEYEDCEDSEWVEGGSEDAFLTDEEYDILDASDEEFNFGSPSK